MTREQTHGSDIDDYALNYGVVERNDVYTTQRIDIDQPGYEAWIDVTVLRQFYGERQTLLSVQWQQRTRSEDLGQLRGPSGEAYQFPSGATYVRHESGYNSYGSEFVADEAFEVDDLLNLAAAQWDGMFWPYDVDSTSTNPFRPFLGI